MRSAIAVLLGLGPLATLATTANAQVSIQEALLRAKPAVVLVVTEVSTVVTLDCGSEGRIRTEPPPMRETGTGWIVASDGWVITNAHVVAAGARPNQLATKGLAQHAVRPGCRQVSATSAASISVILSNGTHLDAKVAKLSPPLDDREMSGRNLALLRIEASGLPALTLGDSAALKIGDRLHILGFPGVVLTHELLSSSSKVEASVTNGAISGFKEDRAGHPVIQTDAPAAWGNSGGPAVDDRGLVVGVLTFVSMEPGVQGSLVQGFNFVIPTQAVREFLDGSGVAPGTPSAFNEAWHAGLREFFAGEHGAAEDHLGRANRLTPGLPDVMRIVAENRERLRNPPPKPFPWGPIAGGLTAVSLAGYGTLFAMRWGRNRFRLPPADVVRLLEGADPPVLVDARDRETYARSPVRLPNAVHISRQELESGAVGAEVDPARTVVAYCT